MRRRLNSLLTAAVAGAVSLALQPAPQPAPPKPAAAAPLFVEGVVKGPDGKPVEAALVLARATTSQDPPDSAKTDASGRFKIAARRSTSHLVRVEAKGFASKTLESVAPGKPLDVVLQKGAVIRGAVFDGRSAEPVPGARVEARSSEVSLALPSDPTAGVVKAATDAKGRFRLENVPPGLYTLMADARGYGRAWRSSVATGGSAELFLFPGASIVGTVRDVDDKPVAGAVVRVESEMLFRAIAPSAAATSAEGAFVLTGVEPGTYRLVVRHPDFAPGAATEVVVRPESEATAEVVLSAGGRVVGRLLDGDGKALRGRVVVSDLDGRAAARALADLLRAEADADGRFRLATLPPGSHVLSVSAPGHAPSRVDVGVRDGQETDAGDVVLEPGLAIRGSVRTKAGAPIPDATVHTIQTPSLPLFTTQTEADGTFTLGGVGAGRLSLRATAPGHAEARKTAEAGHEGVDFVLNPAGVLTGTVVDEAGRPVETFRVTARGPQATGPNMPFSFQSKSVGAADGRFSLELGGEGAHVVEVAAPQHATASVSNVQVVLGQTVDVGRVRLSSGGSVHGLVVDPAGAPVPGASVTVSGAGRDLMGAGPQGTSDVSGAFDIRGIPAGTVEAVASHPSFAEGRATGIEVDPGKGPSEARIVMTRGGRIDGAVRRRDGSGLPGITAMLFPTQGPMMSGPRQAVTGEDGTFTLDNVRAGRARVTLMTGTSGRYTSMQDREVDVVEGGTTSVEFVSREILLSGRVTRNGQAAPGLQLRLSTPTGVGAMVMMSMPDTGWPSGPQRMVAITDADGRYEMIANESGKLRMNATSTDNRLSLPMRVVEIPDVDAHVANLDYSGAPVSGVVVDKESGLPIADARVTAMPKNPQPGQVGLGGGSSATSGPDGRFQLEVEPAEYRIEARATGYAMGSLEFDIGASGIADARLALVQGSALEGKVVDERGRPISGVTVVASIPVEPGENRSTPSFGGSQTMGDGSFAITGLLQQPHVLVVRSNVGSFAVQPGVSPGDKDVTLTLKPGGMLQILVVGPDGTPTPGAFTTVTSVNGVRAMSLGGASTSGLGTTEFATPAGSIEIRATKDKLQGTASVSVPERGKAAVEVKLSEGPPKARLP